MTDGKTRKHCRNRRSRPANPVRSDFTEITFTETHPEPTGEQTVSTLLTYDEARERLVMIGVLGRSS